MKTANLVEATCRICGYPAPVAMLSVREMMFGSKERFDYFSCAACGCLQIAQIPDDLGRHYGEGYYSFAPRTTRRGLAGLLVHARNRYLSGAADPLGRAVARFKPYLALASLRRLKLSHDARIVDVGCGGGELLQTLQSVGFKRLLGVDPFVAHDLDLGGGLHVRKANLAELREPVDLVMFHHSLEHIGDQQGLLAAAHALLVPGGRCLVRIPTVSSWAWRNYGADWCALDAPRHLYLHSKMSIGLLAEQVGFDVEDVVSDSTTFQFWGSEQYRRDIQLMQPGSHDIAPAPGVFTTEELRTFEQNAQELNRTNDGDQIVVYLRRSS
jgi:2-polyprenyl-3-methyl-5-hydroxy-6-metoxy-1,4-benzoquinol methylase